MLLNDSTYSMKYWQKDAMMCITRPEIIKYSDLSYFIIFTGQAQVVLCKGNSKKTKRSKKNQYTLILLLHKVWSFIKGKDHLFFSFSSYIKYIHLKIILSFYSWKYEKSWLAKLMWFNSIFFQFYLKKDIAKYLENIFVHLNKL